MLFSSIPFLFYFLPAVLLLYFLVPKFLKNAVLLLFSLIFYGWGEPVYVILMVATILIYYFCGLAMGKSGPKMKKAWLTVSVVAGVALLGVFKYADFLIGNVNGLFHLNIPLTKLSLPIGISFYTFQCMSYTVDVYRGETAPQTSIVNFGAYVSLFPQLIAGPIVRYVDVARELEQRETKWEDVQYGIRRFLVGLGKKILLANQFGQLIESFRGAEEQSVLFFWMYGIAFMLHIYFDFSGYSDMAIGLGRIFGFHFVENFDHPYLSRSVTEFWRRWHISLGSWFRDYVYIPMGGNRVSKARWILNILTVWMLTGLWHGAAWNFVLWGLLFAVLLLAEKWIPVLKKLPNWLQHGYVLLIVMLSFVLFNAESLTQAGSDLAGLFGFGGHPGINRETIYYLRSYGLLFVLGAVGATSLPRDWFRKLEQTTAGGKLLSVLEPLALFGILILCSAYLVDGSFNPFLYFRF